MGPKENPESGSLSCPECSAAVVWNGEQFVCVSCRWTEHQAKPPSSKRIEIPKPVRDRKKDKPK